jgi:hypothetical protein
VWGTRVVRTRRCRTAALRRLGILAQPSRDACFRSAFKLIRPCDALSVSAPAQSSGCADRTIGFIRPPRRVVRSRWRRPVVPPDPPLRASPILSIPPLAPSTAGESGGWRRSRDMRRPWAETSVRARASTQGRRHQRGSYCREAAVRAMPVRLLLSCLLLRSSWLTVEGDRHSRRRRSAASPGRTGIRGRVGQRGWWRSIAAGRRRHPRLLLLMRAGVIGFAAAFSPTEQSAAALPDCRS